MYPQLAQSAEAYEISQFVVASQAAEVSPALGLMHDD